MTADLSIHTKIKGEFRLVLNKGTDREQDTGWFDNMVLDQGLDYLATGTDLANYLSIGTGSTAPAAGQTSLVAHHASVTLNAHTRTNVGSPTYGSRNDCTYIFAQGAVVGNMTEIGVGRVTGGSQLFSRCLIVDNTGVPTALTVVALDQLTVYYRCTFLPVLTDATGTVTISGVNYDYVARLANAGGFMDRNLRNPNFGAWRADTCTSEGTGSVLGPVTGAPSGGANSVVHGLGISTAAYVSGNFYQDTTITVGAPSGNPTGGIKTMLAINGVSAVTRCDWQWSFNPIIPKDATKVLTLVVRVSWSR